MRKISSSFRSIEERRDNLLSQFASDRRDVLSYIDDLRCLRPGADTSFSFDDALKLLKDMITDEATPIYNFLHASLHYFHCMIKFNVDENYASFVFEAIDALSKEERQLYDGWLNEKHPREPFQINDTFVQYVRNTKLPLTEIGSIILKFSRTVPPDQKEGEGQLVYPYLSADKHIEFLQFIEHTFDMKIPVSIIADFLYFQTTSLGISVCLRLLRTIRGMIVEENLKTLAIPFELYQSLTFTITGPYMESIDLGLSQNCKMIGGKLATYPDKINQLAILIQFVSYPMPMSSFSHLIPSAMDDDKLIFNEQTAVFQNRLESMFDEFRNGHARFSCWRYDSKTKQIYFFCSLLNSLSNPDFASMFRIPVTISSSTSASGMIAFFTLLTAFVDSFGKEFLSENEEQDYLAVRKEPYRVSDEILEKQGAPDEIFNAFLSLNPFLESLWEKYASSFDKNDAVLVKSELYTFIKTLRYEFKRSFYALSNNLELNAQMFSVEEQQKFKIFSINSELKANAEDICLFEDNSFFQHIYKEIEEMRCMNSNYTFEIRLKFHSSLGDDRSMFVTVKKINEEKELIHLTMEIRWAEESEQLMVVYDSFLNEEHFLRLMQWQIHLLLT